MRLCLFLLLFSTMGVAQNLRSGGKLKPEQAIMDIRHYTIALDIDPGTQSIKGYTEIDLILSQPTNVLLFDLWHGMTVKEASVNGKTLSFEHGQNDQIRIAQAFPAGKVKARIAYEGKPGIAERAPWTGGFQWEKDSQGKPWVAVTCQMEGGKIYFPCKDHPSDEPNEGADMILTVPEGLTAADAGPLFCAGITVFYPLLAYGVKPTDKVAVIGVGGLGHLAVQFCHAWGAEVTVFSSTPSKYEEIKELGADHIVSSRDTNTWDDLKGRFDLIIVTVGVTMDWSKMVAMLAPKGRLHFVGIVYDAVPVNVLSLLIPQTSISASPGGSRSAFNTMLDFAVRHNIRAMVEHFPMSSINEAIEHLEAGKANYRIVLDADF